MAINNNKQAVKSLRQRNYLARDFESFRSNLLDYARQYYPDRIKDFSDASLGGLLLDMAAYVGDNMSFYMDHLYSELNYDTAIETKNIERAIKSAGIPISGPSAALVSVDFYIEVPVDASLLPDPTLLPTINAGTTLRADNGTPFVLLEDVVFWKINDDGTVGKASDVEKTNGRRVGNTIVSCILKKRGLCSSGNQKTESIPIGGFVPYRKIQLSESSITKIDAVIDTKGNSYYEVKSLTNDVVYLNVLNTNKDTLLVKDSLKVIPAPYRYITSRDLSTRKVTLTFGGGSADSLEDDVIPDPSEFAIPLPYSQTFSRVSVNPESLLKTSTLGITAENTTLKITYRYGGGLSHNVSAGSVRVINGLYMTFPENPSAALQSQVRNSVEAYNPDPASGGEDPLTSDELVAMIPSAKHAQERIVTKEDLLARIYTMPSNFGRVFRAAITRNDFNPMAIQLHVISRDNNSKLIISPNTLKDNLKKYLNSYRMVSDAIDVYDASIINLELYFQIVVDPTLNKQAVLQSIISDLTRQLSISNFQINQPIIMSDIISTIFARQGVLAVDKVEFRNLYGTVKNKQYSPIVFDVKSNTVNSMLFPPVGGIFEIKYPEINITGKALSNV